ncbi:MAG: CHC2 zinc finger domain-containing protein [Pseudohongiellaceae bacterium]
MAGLIPQSFIDDLLHRVNIVDLIDKRVQLKKSGQNHMACCPFHNEKTPSFSVNEEKQFYHCFGCGVSGNAIGFVMNYQKMEFVEAVETLAQEYGLEVPREQSETEARKQSENARLLEVVKEADAFYQLQLRQHKNKNLAVDYLKARGVSGEIARDFGLGYAPPGWDNLLSATGGEPEKCRLLLTAGLVIKRDNKRSNQRDNQASDKESSQQDNQASDKESNQQAVGFYDRFRNRIMFPIRDSRGRVVAFGGRVLGDDQPKYLNSPTTPVFHKGTELYGLYEFKRSGTKTNRILIVEGYMDVIALAQMGVRNAVATLGTATSGPHLERLFRQVSEVVFCFDGDEAGRKAAWRALEVSLPQIKDGRQIKFLFLPEGEDPDSFVRNKGKEQFDTAIEQATPLEDFFFDKLGEGLDPTLIESKATLASRAKPLLRKLPHGIYAQLMRDRLAETLNMDSEALNQLMADWEQPQADIPPAPPPEAGGTYRDSAGSRGGASKNRGARRAPAASLIAIDLLRRNPEIALNLEQDISPLQQSAEEDKLLLSVIEMVRNKPDIDANTIMGYCHGSSFAKQFIQLRNSEKITPIEGVEEEFKDIVTRILAGIERKHMIEKLKTQLGNRIAG